MILTSLDLVDTDTTINNVALYISIDCSLSMNTVTANGQTRLANLKTALGDVLENLKTSIVGIVDIMGVSWCEVVRSTITRRGVDSADLDDIITWVNSLSTQWGTFFNTAMSEAAAFFAASDSGMDRVVILMTDGESAEGTAEAVAMRNAISGLSVYCFNIDSSVTTYTSQLDNTNSDGVPIVTGGDPDAMQGVIENILEEVTETTTPGVVVSDLWPERDQYPQGVLVDPTVRSGIEKGKPLYRSGDQPLYRTWSYVLRHISPAKKAELQSLQELVGIGAEPMYYTDDRPESNSGSGGGSGGTYTVQFAQPMVFDLDDDGTTYRTEIFLMEYSG